MITVNDSHLKAIARSVHFMRSGITSQMTEKLRSAIERDIELLDQAHKFCRQQIVEPGLPMRDVPETVLKVGESLGNSSGPTPVS